MEVTEKYIVYLDMDGPLADFFGALGRSVEPHEEPLEIYEKDFYTNMPVTKGALEAVHKLLAAEHLEVYIASKPITRNFLKDTPAYCPSEKYEWVFNHFPTLIRKIFLTCNKNLLRGHYLIDDQPNKWDDFEGEILAFDNHNPVKSWEKIVDKLLALGD